MNLKPISFIYGLLSFEMSNGVYPQVTLLTGAMSVNEQGYGALGNAYALKEGDADNIHCKTVPFLFLGGLSTLEVWAQKRGGQWWCKYQIAQGSIILHATGDYAPCQPQQTVAYMFPL